MPRDKMEVEEFPDGWWITGCPEGVQDLIGPYDTKKDALEDLRGVRRFLKEYDAKTSLESSRQQDLQRPSVGPATRG